MAKPECAPEGVEPEKPGVLYGALAWAVKSHALYVALIASLALYVLTKTLFFACLTALALVSLFVAESYYSASKWGWANEAKELLITFAVAALFWYGSGFLLHTSAPLDSIVSCSMLPNLDRGDMVVLQGGVPEAPEVGVSAAEFQANNWTNQGIVCAICVRTDPATGLPYEEPCLASTELTPFGLNLTGEADQSGNLVQYECGICGRRYLNGSAREVPCTKAVAVNGVRIPAGNLSSGTIVYTPAQGDAFKTEIIHRALFRLRAGGEYYYFTKGDNNEQLDMQYGNSPIPQGRTVGVVLFRIPYIGYLKLFLFGFLSQPAGCDSTLSLNQP
ncbi:MAG: hypothetical protein PHF51_00035 [Candidatus ainarchaeum sp.]|nr:hypothetical protein [Candidatus ainarchaeum sp.]